MNPSHMVVRTEGYRIRPFFNPRWLHGDDEGRILRLLDRKTTIDPLT